MSIYIRKDDRPFGDRVASDPSPLHLWFERVGEKKVDFMDRTGIGNRVLYDLLDGTKRDYLYSTLRKVESGTGGEVTVRMIGDWLDRIHKPKGKKA